MGIGKWKITIKDFVWLIICLGLIICFLVGMIFQANVKALEIISGASTAVSIVLSIVAILYTLVEGGNSSRINQDSIARLSSIDYQLTQLTEKIKEQQALDQQLKKIISKLDTSLQQIEHSTKKSRNELLGESAAENVNSLLDYIREDIDE